MNDFLALALTLIIHEAGHAAAAIFCGAPLFGIRARVGGLMLLSRADTLPYPRAAAVYAGGALANLLTAALFSGVQPLASYSVGAAAFNLLPMPGADGEGILSALLSLWLDDPGRAVRIVRFISDAFVFLFWAAAVYLAVTGRGGGMALVFAVGMLVVRLGGGSVY